mgnify:CR=1 FL=1
MQGGVKNVSDPDQERFLKWGNPLFVFVLNAHYTYHNKLWITKCCQTLHSLTCNISTAIVLYNYINIEERRKLVLLRDRLDSNNILFP